MHTQKPFIEVKHVSKRYPSPGKTWFPTYTDVLQDINFEIYPGEIVGLIGLSGKGKSTLARLLLGIEKPDQGEIITEGEPLKHWRSTHRGAMSVVFQNYADSVNPNWTVQEIILEPFRGTSNEASPAIKARTIELLEKVGLNASYLTRYPFELSGGQCQRVCIARALIANPRFIVFDEAVSSLDVSVQAEIIELLKTLRHEKTSWLFISHDIQAVASLCSRVLFLDQGRIVEDLPMNELTSSQNPFVQKLIRALQALKW